MHRPDGMIQFSCNIAVGEELCLLLPSWLLRLSITILIAQDHSDWRLVSRQPHHLYGCRFFANVHDCFKEDRPSKNARGYRFSLLCFALRDQFRL